MQLKRVTCFVPSASIIRFIRDDVLGRDALVLCMKELRRDGITLAAAAAAVHSVYHTLW